MRAGFSLVFWGFLMVVIDVRINHLNVFVPDLIGYLLVALGLSFLARHHRSFLVAMILAWILVPLSIVDLREMPVELATRGNVTYTCDQRLPWIATVMVIDILMMWIMCGGIRSLADQAGNGHLSWTARRTRILYAVLNGLGLGSGLLVYLIPPWYLLVTLGIAGLVGGIVVAILMLILLHRARRELARRLEPGDHP
jgi:hypothetical protein